MGWDLCLKLVKFFPSGIPTCQSCVNLVSSSPPSIPLGGRRHGLIFPFPSLPFCFLSFPCQSSLNSLSNFLHFTTLFTYFNSIPQFQSKSIRLPDRSAPTQILEPSCQLRFSCVRLGPPTTQLCTATVQFQIAGKASKLRLSQAQAPTMLRTSAPSRSLLAGFTKVQVQNARLSYSAAASRFRPVASLQQINDRRPRVVRSIARPAAISLLYATQSKSTADKLFNEKLAVNPEVSTDSSVQHVFEGGAKQNNDNEGDMLAGVKADWLTIKETFSMADVPKDSLYLGMAGLIPYAATSLSTVILSYDINLAHSTGAGYLFAPETAHQLLDLVTPIQIGFGAVVSQLWMRTITTVTNLGL